MQVETRGRIADIRSPHTERIQPCRLDYITNRCPEGRKGSKTRLTYAVRRSWLLLGDVQDVHLGDVHAAAGGENSPAWRVPGGAGWTRCRGGGQPVALAVSSAMAVRTCFPTADSDYALCLTHPNGRTAHRHGRSHSPAQSDPV